MTMNKMRLIIFALAFMMMNNMNGQELRLENYHWNNRVILIISKEGENKKYNSQIEAFKDAYEELEDRKLVIFEVQKKKYRIIDYQGKGEECWQFSDDPYKKYAAKDDGFRVILIGLDGGIKADKREIISKAELFGKIDAMPMRRAELKNKKN